MCIIIAGHGFVAARKIIEERFSELSDVFAEHNFSLSRVLLDPTHDGLQGGDGSVVSAAPALSGCLRGRIKKREAGKESIAGVASAHPGISRPPNPFDMKGDDAK
jgi:hypothetical protein